MDLVQVRSIEVFGQRGQRRQEVDRQFLRSGYRRKVYVCGDPEAKWLRTPRRSRSPLTLVPIPVDEGAVVTLSYLDLEGKACRLSLEGGRYYYLPPNVPYQLEAQGRGVLEIYTPAAKPWETEERLPEDFFDHAAVGAR
jgi:hypothetical protein